MSEMPIFCNQCGASNVAHARFCSACGIALPIASIVPSTHLPAEAPPLSQAPPIPTTIQQSNKKPTPKIVKGCLGCLGIYLLASVLFAIVAVVVDSSSEKPIHSSSTANNASQVVESAAKKQQRLIAEKKRRQEIAEARANERAAERRIERIVIRELQSYEKAGSDWRNILIRRNTSRDDLIKLARKLHREDPSSYFRFLDNDEEFQQYMNWDKNYPSDFYPYPKEWTEKHHIAMINQMSGTWSLNTPIGETIATLE